MTARLVDRPSGQEPASGAAEPEDPARHEDRCKCGADWTSDGNGGRFCEKCRASHPDNPEPYPDGVEEKGSAGEGNGSAKGKRPRKSARRQFPRAARISVAGTEEEVAKGFKEANKRLGRYMCQLDTLRHLAPDPRYKLAMDAARAAGKVLEEWAREKGVP